MKSIDHKTYPYPVLSPLQRDYPHASMHVEIKPVTKSHETKSHEPHPHVLEPSGEVDFVVDFHGVDDHLAQMVSRREACYGLEVFCEATWSRYFFPFYQAHGVCSCVPWRLLGAVEAYPFIVSLCDDASAVYPHTHEEFHGECAATAFTRRKGDVLAWGHPFRGVINYGRENHNPSLFHVRVGDDVGLGMFRVDLSGDSVAILLHEDDMATFHGVRRQGRQRHWLLSSVYLCAVVETLYHMRFDGDTHRHTWWYQVIDRTLEQKGLTLCDSHASLLDIAQHILTAEEGGDAPLGNALRASGM